MQSEVVWREWMYTSTHFVPRQWMEISCQFRAPLPPSPGQEPYVTVDNELLNYFGCFASAGTRTRYNPITTTTEPLLYYNYCVKSIDMYDLNAALFPSATLAIVTVP
jgi:hypothetical protein